MTPIWTYLFSLLCVLEGLKASVCPFDGDWQQCDCDRVTIESAKVNHTTLS